MLNRCHSKFFLPECSRLRLWCSFRVIANKYQAFSYLGIDVSEDMVQAAKQRHQNNAQARFIVSDKPDNIADYGVASGIFNVRLGFSDAEWRDHFEAALDSLYRTSRGGGGGGGGGAGAGGGGGRGGRGDA